LLAARRLVRSLLMTDFVEADLSEPCRFCSSAADRSAVMTGIYCHLMFVVSTKAYMVTQKKCELNECLLDKSTWLKLLQSLLTNAFLQSALRY